MFSVKVYCEYSGPNGNDYDEEFVSSWDEAIKIAKKFQAGIDDGKEISGDIGLEISDYEGKKFVDMNFNDFNSKVMEYGKVSFGYNRHDLIKED